MLADRVILGIALVGGGVLSLVLGLDAGFDHLNYHHYNPWGMLHGRIGHDWAPAQLQTFYNPLIDLPLYLLAAAFGGRVAGFAMGAFHGLALWLVWRMAWMLLGEFIRSSRTRGGIAVLCAGAGVYAPAVIFEHGGPQGDSTVAVPILAGLLLLLVPGAWRSRRLLVLSGLLIGAGSVLKLTAGVAAVGVALALPLLAPAGTGWRERARAWATWMVALAAGCALVDGVHLVHMTVRFGNPVFPFLNFLFESPWALAEGYADSPYIPDGVVAHLAFPFAIGLVERTAEYFAFRDVRFALVALALAAAVPVTAARFARGRQLPPPAVLFFVAAVAGAYGVWQLIHAVYRYLVPQEVLAPLVVALAVLWVARSWRGAAGIVAVALLIGIAAVRLPPQPERIPYGAGSLFDVRPPVIEAREGQVLVLAGDEPTSYVLPYLPAELRHVRIASNLVYPDDPTVMNERIREAIVASPEPVLALRGPGGLPAQYLEAYGLVVDGESCRAVRTRIGEDLAICELRSSPNPPSAGSAP